MTLVRSWMRALRLVVAAAPRGVAMMTLLFIGQGIALGFGLELLRRLVNELLAETSTRSELLPLVAATAALLAANQIAAGIAGQIRFVVSEKVTRRSVDHFLELSAAVPYEEFLEPRFHDRFALARRGATGAAWSVVFGVVQLLSAIPPLVAIVVVIARIDPLLAVILGVAEAPLLLANSASARMMRSLSARLASNDRERNRLFTILTGKTEAAELRTHGLSGALRNRHERLAAVRLDEVSNLARRRAGFQLVGSVVSAIGLGLALYYVITRSIDGAITVGDAGIAVIALQQLAARLRSMGQGASALVEQSFFVEYLFDDELGRHARRPTIERSAFAGVAVRSVSYRYPNADRDAVRDLDLVIEPGGLVALVGPNGAGKTTTFGLLQGLLTPTAGTIEWTGGHPPDVAAVLQDPIRFDLPVADVIALGRPDEPLDPIAAEWALASVGLDQVLSLEDRLGAAFEGGRDLSGGQWQRLAIARALYRRSDLCLLDEPGAHLDPDAELRLFAQLRQQVDTGGATVVVTTHRASTLRFADRVILIDDGRIICDVDGRASLQAPAIADLFAAQLLGDPPLTEVSPDRG